MSDPTPTLGAAAEAFVGSYREDAKSFELKPGVRYEVVRDRFLALRAALAAEARSEVCCGDFANCLRACTPRGEWLERKRLEAAEPPQPASDHYEEARDEIRKIRERLETPPSDAEIEAWVQWANRMLDRRETCEGKAGSPREIEEQFIDAAVALMRRARQPAPTDAEAQHTVSGCCPQSEALAREVQRLAAAVKKLHDDFVACGHETSARMMRAKFPWLAERGKEAGDGR